MRLCIDGLVRDAIEAHKADETEEEIMEVKEVLNIRILKCISSWNLIHGGFFRAKHFC